MMTRRLETLLHPHSRIGPDNPGLICALGRYKSPNVRERNHRSTLSHPGAATSRDNHFHSLRDADPHAGRVSSSEHSDRHGPPASIGLSVPQIGIRWGSERNTGCP